MNRIIKFVEVKSGICAPCARGKLGAELGIDAIKNAAITNDSYLFVKDFPDSVVAVHIEDQWNYAKKNFETYKTDLHYNVKNDRFTRHITYLVDSCEKIASVVKETLDENKFPFVLAGDHSTAVGTIAGIKQKYPDKRLGVIWIDAHADLHSPYTTPSGNMHGMPVAAVMGFDDNTAREVQVGLEAKKLKANLNPVSVDEAAQRSKLCHIGGAYPMINKEDMVYIGIRDIEQEERRFIDTYIKHFDGKYVQDHGVENIVSQTLQYLEKCDMIYVSFDIDSIDGRIVRGTGTPVPDGLTQYQAQELLSALYQSNKLVSLEMVEINPLLDDVPGNSIDNAGLSKACQFETRNGTAEIAFNIIKHILQ